MRCAITFGIDEADTGDSVQGGLIPWAHPEEVVAEQGSGGGWSRFIPQRQINYVYMNIHTYFTIDKVYTYTLACINVTPQ